MLNLINAILSVLISLPQKSSPQWKQLTSGMEMLELNAKIPNSIGDSKITVVRIDTRNWELVFAGISQYEEERGKTAREWCEIHHLTLAINAGMFATDYETHVGYLKYRDHINSSHVNTYQSVLAFDPHKGKGLPPFQIYDLDKRVTIQTILKDYNSVIQNLRLIKKPGINVWKQQERAWSEAAIGEDKEGRILFIFSRSPFSMYDLNKELLESGIGIVAAQHLEGGPEAQLYIKVADFELEMFGSYETSFNEDDKNTEAWPIPNVIGLRLRR